MPPRPADPPAGCAVRKYIHESENMAENKRRCFSSAPARTAALKALLFAPLPRYSNRQQQLTARFLPGSAFEGRSRRPMCC